MNNKIFISGRITGDPGYKIKFAKACFEASQPDFFDRHGTAELTYKYEFFGFRPVDPCEITILGIPVERYVWSVCMAACLCRLIGCSYVYMLSDWQESRGARIEHAVAQLLRKTIIYENLKTNKTIQQ